jgi:Ca2+-binding RTX toxin-like protein
VHHVFHSEHNRLTGDIAGILETSAADAMRDAWHATGPSGWDYEERLFQAARFVTEMEYQHLAFEEFARKVQPMVNLFGEGGTGYHSNLDPAIRAEFAHAVYRFGHSMLTESVDRTDVNGVTNNIDLLDAFLNPPAFMEAGTDPRAAAGDVVRGMTRQVGNELDEFVTDALRNDLLGLPLDLASLNMARARESGVPTLNEARRAFNAETSDSALAPYTSWADLKFSLKHPESLTNLIAAYGTHSSITDATTLAGKRAAAEALLAKAADDQTVTENEEAYNFINSLEEFENGANGVTTTGVDDIDLWVGGLAEKQHVFGGLLGPTFNYVFEGQMEDLQDGDRMYYLSRTAGLNLLTQLEGNSFAELIQRNTDVEGLPADSFSRPDYVFQVAKLGTSGPVVNDPATAWNEASMLTRTADGTIRYGGPAHVVFNGSSGNDRVHSSEGDDTIRGNDGNDRMEGGDGADNLIGGKGDDIMNDLFGDDVLKGGDGNDALSSGRGFGGDLNQSGRGHDFVVGGNDITETFAGAGNDFVFAGDAEDTVFGDDGDDWIEGGKGPFNLLQGDNGAPFQDDPNEPGHDVMFSYGGEQDYDAEGGDDVMLLGPGIQRAEGMLGFDWTSHKNDPQAANSDMDITGLLPPSVDTNRDRFDLTEALSGWKLNDTLRGDSRVADDMEGHELNAEGIARVTGLGALLGGASSFTGGNILIGGAGNDLIEGRGGNDLIDGDAWLNVQIRVPDLVNGGTKLVENMSAVRADVFAGRINPGALSIVRTIETGASGSDTAAFSGPFANYTITSSAATGITTVTDNVGTDGIDTLRNVELLRFTDRTTSVGPPSAPVIGTATGLRLAAATGSATLTWTRPSGTLTGQEILIHSPGVADRTLAVGATVSNRTITGLVNGQSYTFQVRGLNTFGPGPYSAVSNSVVPVGLPGTVAQPVGNRGDQSVDLNWTAPSTGGDPIVGYTVQVRTGATIQRTITLTGTATSLLVDNLNNGTAYNFRVAATNSVGTGTLSAASAAVTPATLPGRPIIQAPTQGAAGGALTANANWLAPTSTGGAAITNYRVTALRMAADGVTPTGTPVVNVVGPNVRTRAFTLPAGNYRFEVVAINNVGDSLPSDRSGLVAPR